MFAKVYCFLARVLSLHRANCQTISMYPVCFSKDFGNNIFFLLFFFGIFCFSIFFTFFCFLFVCVFFLFETKKIYSDTYSTMQARKWWRNFIWQISRNLATFFGLIWDFFSNSFEGMFYTFLYVLVTDKTVAAIFFLEF